jgi:hypothetical protein
MSNKSKRLNNVSWMYYYYAQAERETERVDFLFYI